MGTEIAKKPLRQVTNVRELLVNDMAKQQLATVAAKHMRPERMMRIMANALRTTPQLAECEPLSLLGAMMTSASLGLEPNTPLGQAYLIPFKNRKKGITEVQFIIGWKGMIALARRSGAVVSIHADVAYQDDEFSFEYGSNQHLRHKPTGDRTNPEYAYCHAKLTDGEAFIVLPWSEIIKTRDNSQGYKTAIKYGKQDTPWIAHLHAMARKTAVRRLFDELPISIEEVSDAVEVDEQRVDYSSYAMNPDQGATIEGEFVDEESDEEDSDGQTIEGEAEQPKEDPKPEPEKKAAQDEKPKDEPKKGPAKKQDAPKDEPKGEPEKKADGEPEEPEAYLNPIDDIRGDLLDGMKPDQVKKFYEEPLAGMAKDYPEFHAAFLKEIEDYAK